VSHIRTPTQTQTQTQTHPKPKPTPPQPTPGAAGLAYIRVQEGGAIDAAKPIKEGLNADQTAALIAAAGARPVRRLGRRLGCIVAALRLACWSVCGGEIDEDCEGGLRRASCGAALAASFLHLSHASLPLPSPNTLPTPTPQPLNLNPTQPKPNHHPTQTKPIQTNPQPNPTPTKNPKHQRHHQGDLLLLAAGPTPTVHRALDRVRLFLSRDLRLTAPSQHALLWVTDFPMFEWNEGEGRLEALHHPFTAPNPEDVEAAGGDLRGARALAYDLVYNGVEIGGGSLRIYR